MKNSPRTLLSPPPNIQTRDRHMGKDIHPFSRSGHTTDGEGWRGAFHKRARSAIRSRPTENILRPLMLLARSTEARTSSPHTSCSYSFFFPSSLPYPADTHPWLSPFGCSHWLPPYHRRRIEPSAQSSPRFEALGKFCGSRSLFSYSPNRPSCLLGDILLGVVICRPLSLDIGQGECDCCRKLLLLPSVVCHLTLYMKEG